MKEAELKVNICMTLALQRSASTKDNKVNESITIQKQS